VNETLTASAVREQMDVAPGRMARGKPLEFAGEVPGSRRTAMHKAPTGLRTSPSNPTQAQEVVEEIQSSLHR
jgi:hypothetical protein